MSCLCIKYGEEECCGPCYDFCDCRHCWNGWKTIPFRTRLRWRIERIWRDLHQPPCYCGEINARNCPRHQ